MSLLAKNMPWSCSKFSVLLATTCRANCPSLMLPCSSSFFCARTFSFSASRVLSDSSAPDVPSTTLIYQKGMYRKYCSFKGNFIAKFSEEIDLDSLREKKVNELKNSGKHFHVHDVVKKILAQKCDEAILNLNEEDRKKLKIIQLEHDFLFSEGYIIPSTDEMTSENWLEALNLSSKQRRLRYYIAWQKKKFMKENAKRKKAEKSKLTQQEQEKDSVSVRKLEANDNNILLRIYDSTIKRFLNHRLTAAMRFGIPLVLDMGYADYMENREVRNTASQIQDVYCINRSDQREPFHLHLTDCGHDNPIYRTFQLLMQDDPHLMATVTPQSYLELFDKQRLVYLSPNGKQVMQSFDPNAVYIIGAFNDKATQKPISYARAKEQGIKCQRLPLDHYLKWNIGSKSLTLNQIMAIFTAIKNGQPWPDALKAVPSRKYRPDTSR